jgi:OOP family OmpA-OmpF porin
MRAVCVSNSKPMSQRSQENYMTRFGIQPRKTLLALTLMLAASGAIAQDSGWYGGLNFGRSWADVDNRAITSVVQANGSTVSTLRKTEEDNSWKVLGGYSFNQNLALEASWFDLGQFGFDTAVLPAANGRGRSDLEGVGLDLVGTFPIAERLSFLARLGVNNTRIKDRYTNSFGGRLVNDSDRNWYANYGVGLQFALTDRFDLRTELTRYAINDIRLADNNVDTLSVGVNYKFGAKPAPVVAAPAPAPQPEPAPEPKPLMEVTLGAEALFDFDKSELKPEGRTRLDQLLRDMEPLQYDNVVVIGHADRIGTRDYNISLSNRRAAAVREYLVRGGVTAANITAVGRNSDEPVTTPQQCAGRRGDALIACYAPDRRVVVQVNGTRQGE